MKKIISSPTVMDTIRLMSMTGETVEHEDMWIDIANYRRIHDNCIHVCLPKITIYPHYKRDLEIKDADDVKCQYGGRGIFCYGWSYAGAEDGENSRNDKKIVPLKKHFHCYCSDKENKEVFCVVHENSQEYQESISFLRRQEDEGYADESDDHDDDIPSPVVDVFLDLTQSEREQLFNEFQLTQV